LKTKYLLTHPDLTISCKDHRNETLLVLILLNLVSLQNHIDPQLKNFQLNDQISIEETTERRFDFRKHHTKKSRCNLDLENIHIFDPMNPGNF